MHEHAPCMKTHAPHSALHARALDVPYTFDHETPLTMKLSGHHAQPHVHSSLFIPSKTKLPPKKKLPRDLLISRMACPCIHAM